MNSILCLGDSYTIGEGVALHDSFPYQTLQLLRNANYQFEAPEIVAKTGWTSFELLAHLQHIKLKEHYEFATLLIGVNNQYRELSTEEFKNDFEVLLKKALHSVGGKQEKIIIISIPDWGVTPFAEGRDRQKIAEEIDLFNAINKQETEMINAHYINITPNSRLAANDLSLIAEDKLHPSALAYAYWAKDVADVIKATL